MIKQGDVFTHPDRFKRCVVTRFYSNTRWYYKFLNSEKEYLSTFAAEAIKPIAVQRMIDEYQPFVAGQKVKINKKEIAKSKFKYTNKFLSFVEANEHTVFTVKSNESHIVSLEDCEFTFWEKFLIKI